MIEALVVIFFIALYLLLCYGVLEALYWLGVPL